VIVVLAVALGSCGRGEFEDRTAVVRLGGSTETYTVTSCGLDGQTVYLVAASDSGSLLQAVVGLEEDDRTGIAASTGVSIDPDARRDDLRVAAFGDEAWERRGQTGTPPGRIGSARLRGSRIQFSGDVVAVDANDVAVADGDQTAFSVDARCDERED